ncbi:hypothetical protein D3C85_1092240 [compost metagenome]
MLSNPSGDAEHSIRWRSEQLWKVGLELHETRRKLNSNSFTNFVDFLQRFLVALFVIEIDVSEVKRAPLCGKYVACYPVSQRPWGYL